MAIIAPLRFRVVPDCDVLELIAQDPVDSHCLAIQSGELVKRLVDGQ